MKPKKDDDEVEFVSKPLKPYSRNKQKKKYETLDDVGSEINIFINIRSQVEIHHEDGKG
jgi:hypothetical protein